MKWLTWQDFLSALYEVLVLLLKCILWNQRFSGQSTRVITPILTWSSAALGKKLIFCFCFIIYKRRILIYWASLEYNEV